MAVKFTAQQEEASLYRDVDACIVAGPGAGKTTVLVERYRRLVQERHFEPRHILAITFTEKAAANMKAKLAEKFADNAVLRRDIESAWVSTIHGFCMRLLRENAIAAGLDPRFQVLSPREADTLQWECLQFALDEITEQDRERTLELIEALHSPDMAGDLRSAYEGIRSAGKTIAEVRRMECPSAGSDNADDLVAMVDELRALLRGWPDKMTANQRTEKGRLLEWCGRFPRDGVEGFDASLQLLNSLDLKLPKVPQAIKDDISRFRDRFRRLTTAEVDHHAGPYREMIFRVLARFDEEYRSRKNARGRVDFNDLERYAIALLRNNPETARRVRAQFRQVMLDEYQDINGQQAELIQLLRAENVFFGVGDENQSIYGFRHARPEIFRQYRDDVELRNGQSVDLLHNFRSRQVILDCICELMADAAGVKKRELISGANFAARHEPVIEVMEIRDAGEDTDAASQKEAAWIAYRVAALAGSLMVGEPGETRAAQFRDFAVLCRNGDSMPAILTAFDRAGIPYVCGRRESFLRSRIGLDIKALLSVIANPRDGISLATVLRSPLVGVSDEGLLRVGLLANSLASGLNRFAWNSELRVALDEPDASRLDAFCRRLDRWRRDQPVIPLHLLLARALDDCGVAWSPLTREGADIESFLQLARSGAWEMDLPAFLNELDGVEKAMDLESELSDEEQGNCVRVMTAHAAKGLEFPVTIVAAMGKGARSDTSPVTFTPEHGLGLKWRDPSKDSKDGLKDSWAEANAQVADERESGEEERLLYVATTRAAEHLILSWSRAGRKASHWAKRADRCFGVSDRQPSAEAVVEQKNGFEVSILVTEADPPLLPTASERDAAAEVVMVARPQLSDQHETTVAVTSLAVFAQCPRKYFIERSLGWNSGRFRRFDPEDISADEEEIQNEDDASLPASQLGSAVHEILAGVTPAEESAEARRLADVFFTSELGRRAGQAGSAAREWKFIFAVGELVVRGSIDIWFEEDGRLLIVDYKTDDIPVEETAARAREYETQLAIYAMALERAMGKRPAGAWLHFLRTDTLVEVPLVADSELRVRQLVAALRRAQDDLDFPLHEAAHCRTCRFYKSLCPAGRENVILEEI